MKNIIVSALLMTSLGVSAQTIFSEKKMFNRLDLSVTAGTTGIGFDFATPVGDYVQLRAGAVFMPTIKKNMNFGIDVSKDGEREISSEQNASRFDKMANLLEGMTGIRAQDHVTMVGTSHLNNFKFMVDVFPFRNKHWHITAGFFLGSSQIGTAINAVEDAQSLVAVNMYNKLRNRILAREPMMSAEVDGKTWGAIEFSDYRVEQEAMEKFEGYGSMGMRVGYYSHDIVAENDVYYDMDVYQSSDLNSLFDDDNPMTPVPTHKKGDIKYHKGDVIHHKGDPYKMLPDEDNTVSATAKVNKFKPYLGFGYGGPITKDKRTSISFDAGMIFWGGSPKIITHDGVDLVNDLYDLNGKVRNYVNLIKGFKVYPEISVRITHTLF